MTNAWWAGLAPVTHSLACGAAEHRLEWRAGELRAVDHPDAERELTLVALGGNPQPCLEILSSWRRHADDLDALALGRRGPSDRLVPGGHRPYATRVVGPMVGRTRMGWSGYAPLQRHAKLLRMDDDAELESLFRHAALGDRLVATVIAAWCERIESGADVADVRARLRAALYGRVRLAVRDWLGADVEPEVQLVDPGAPAYLDRAGEQVVVALPFAWLRDVWARGFTSVLGRFVLRAELDASGQWHLLTVGTDSGPSERITISAN